MKSKKKEWSNNQDSKRVNNVNKNITFLIITFTLLTILSINSVSAYKWVCLKYGQSLPNSINPRYTCWHDSCRVCATDNNYPTSFNKCKDSQECGSQDGEIDITPPNLTINSPKNSQVFNSRMVLISLSSNEPASFYYKDNKRGSWKRLASLMSSFSRGINFKEGFNNITIKAVDRNNNYIEKSVSFYVDSKKPKITKTSPKDFANGAFSVEFREDNPKNLVLYYGINDIITYNVNQNLGIRTHSLNLNECSYNKNYICYAQVNLADFDGKKIVYWFKLEDIAGNIHESKQISLKVDFTNPKILNSDFWSQGTGRNNKNIYFNIEIEEENFAEVLYVNAVTLASKTICSKIKNNKCVKKLGFNKGSHILDIYVKDKAGNSISKRIEFSVV